MNPVSAIELPQQSTNDPLVNRSQADHSSDAAFASANSDLSEADSKISSVPRMTCSYLQDTAAYYSDLAVAYAVELVVSTPSLLQ